MSLIWLLYLCALVGISTTRDVHFYVSPNGSDANNGSTTQLAFKTLKTAINKATSRAYTTSDNLFIELLPGYHDLTGSLYINQHHAKLLTIRSYKGQEVHVTGGRHIPASKFHSVTDHNIINALAPSARRHVKYINLRQLNITDFGTLKQYGFHEFRSAPLEVFHNGQAFRMAQWPNYGYTNVVGTPDGRQGLRFKYNSTKPSTWRHLDDLWVYGFWVAGWADRSAKVTSIDTKNMIVTLANSTTRMLGIKTGHWGESGRVSEGGYFRFINVLSELDVPGEYYLDRKTGNLYVWLPSTASTDMIYVSTVKNCIVFAGPVKNVVLSNFVLEICRERGVYGNNVRNIQITNMEVRNTGDFAISLGADSRGCTVTKSKVHDGDGGIALSGGNRKLLVSSGNLIEDNEIYSYARVSAIGKDAIHVNGVGNLIRYNNIHDGATTAIRYYGNDHVFEYNNIHHVCVNLTYCSSIMSGNDWTFRGIKIRYNYIHDVLRFAPGNQVYGIQLEHQVSSALVTNNVFYNNEVHLQIAGGRNNIITENIMYNATRSSIAVDGQGRDHPNANMVKDLHAMPYKEALWKARYPKLAEIDNGNKFLPEGNVIYKNLIYSPSKRLISGLTGWVDNVTYYNVSDIGFSYGAEDHFNPKIGDLRLRCRAADWANKVNFHQVVTPNEVGPRYDAGPSFSKIGHKTIQLRTPPSKCATHQPSPPPMPAYLPDGSKQPPIYKVFDEGCWLHVDKCTNDPKAAGTYRDMTGERFFHAAVNETMCFKRALEQWKFCGSKPNEQVAAIYGPTGVMSYGGLGCLIATYGCPLHGGPLDGHQVDGRIYHDRSAEDHRNASLDRDRCLPRAHDVWTFCGSNPNHTVTAVFLQTGEYRTVGAGCWIETMKCVENPNQPRMYYDTHGAVNYQTDDFEFACLARAKEFWTQCGSDTRYPVTAHYRPTSESLTYP